MFELQNFQYSFKIFQSMAISRNHFELDSLESSFRRTFEILYFYNSLFVDISTCLPLVFLVAFYVATQSLDTPQNLMSFTSIPMTLQTKEMNGAIQQDETAPVTSHARTRKETSKVSLLITLLHSLTQD